MRKISVSSLEPSMILAEPVYNSDFSLELLSKGTVIKRKHIDMLENLGVFEVVIFENLPEQIEESISIDEMIESIESLQAENNFVTDTKKLRIALEELRELEIDEEVASICNVQMPITLLTGEGNLPLDKRHSETINDTKELLKAIVSDNVLDADAIKDNVKEMLPDMIRNNDVLMRLNQLKEADDYTFDHALRVSILAAMIGKWMGYDQEHIEELAFTGLLFDIGKLKLPTEVLNYPGKLSDKVFEVVKNHAQWGYQTLLKTKGVSQSVKFAALQHHERIDGSGYPLRLKGDQINDYAKIIMVCDVFDAMTHDRVFQKKVSAFKASDYLAMHSGTLFDTQVVYTLLSNLATFYLGKKCTLNTGEQGKIIYIDVNYPTRPIVQIESRFIDLSKQHNIQIVEIE